MLREGRQAVGIQRRNAMLKKNKMKKNRLNFNLETGKVNEKL